LEVSVSGFEVARKMSVFDRAQILFKAAAHVSSNLEEFATVIAREGSKTIREARKEASRCVNTLMVSAEESKRILGETIPSILWPISWVRPLPREIRSS
jgi:glyceraldehyde-3-phosphate dehydrogenase (NADP+)